jgi:hypothetical protein
MTLGLSGWCHTLKQKECHVPEVSGPYNQIVSCEEKTRLVQEYQMATQGFADAVTELQRKMGTSAKEEYEQLNRVADEARLKAEHARIALEQHAAAHRC